MILRQLADNKCMWLDMCKTNPCITAFIAMNGHHSQTAGSGDQSNLAQSQDMEADHVDDQVEQFQQHIRTVRGRNVHTMAAFPVKFLMLRWFVTRPFTNHHPAPTPAGGHVRQDLITTKLPTLPLTAPWLEACTNGGMGQTIGPTATQSASPSARMCLAALRPPAHQHVDLSLMVHHWLGTMTLRIQMQ